MTTAGPHLDRLDGDQVTLVPVRAGHVADLRRILATPQVRRVWGDEDASPNWPFDKSSTALTVLHHDVVVGMVQYVEETDPDYRHASIDIFLDPAIYGRGICTDAVRTLATHLLTERGHHRLVIDPAADNHAAIRCYQKVGFRPVGIMRQYERDADGKGWHDGLLMDLLAADLVSENMPSEHLATAVEPGPAETAEVEEAAESADEETAETQTGDAAVAEGYAIGDTIAMGDLEHTFHGARFSDGDEFLGPEEGTRWLLIDVEVTNNSDESEPISSMMMWSLVDSDNRTNDQTITTDEQGSVDGELGAGRSMRGEIAYEVSADESEWELIFEPHLFGFGQGIYAFSADQVN